uniref:Uncharacterized protein n=1 Tax=Gopherus evgoodei TaxID=1825980 RepID=A0A8C4XYY1_9SAUR
MVPVTPAGPCLRCVAQGSCYWFLAVVVKGTGRQSPEDRVLCFSIDPDIVPSWYIGRGMRPVGRFGRRRADPVASPGPAGVGSLWDVHGWAEDAECSKERPRR